MKAARYLRDALVFAPCYVLLDWVSYLHPLGPFNITPWNPQPAIAIVWMFLSGLVHAPAVLGTITLADLLVRGAPGGHAVTLLTAAVLTLGYAGIAHLLRLLMRAEPSLFSLRQLTVFIAVVVPSTAAIALGFVGVLYAAGLLPVESFVPGWLQFWVGDAVGVLVTAPLLLVAADGRQRRSFVVLIRRGETYLQMGLVALAIWLIFRGLGGDPSHHVYLLFLPLIWVALRSGLTGAIVAVAVVQIGVVVGIHRHSLDNLPIIELQALVAALTLTALYLGVTVDERQRATEKLKHSLRLAAAGEMAGAISHEVSQPLTALSNYGRSAQLLVEAGRSAELPAVIERMMSEAQRASEVVRRLRDFFRGGTTRLEEVAVADLLEAAKGVAAGMTTAPGIAVTATCEPGLPRILVDRLQMELVVRNLVANAVESIRSHTPQGGRIDLVASREDARRLRIEINDSGPGVSPEGRERIFEPFVSGKSTGMGLGLAVSRAIVEAHGGTLDSRPGAHGEFRLVLPLEGKA